MNGLAMSSQPPRGLLARQSYRSRTISRIQEHLHVICPLGIAIVNMGRPQRPDIVRLAVVVPSDDLEEPRTKSKDLVPAVVPQ